MTTQAPTRTRHVWKDTQATVHDMKLRTPRPARTEQLRPATKTQAEKEADRWVAEMMFDHYNG